ncbi:MAG: hypothetical protein ABJF10_23710 [Chthoniobacter sp.]|uniref:hypothetical protein n=1 Tax=Chthoniobacter sp. TaxID=2510640 RepID=UPI0032A92BE5
MNSPSLKIALLAGGLCLVFQATSRAGTEKQFPDYNFAVTVPDSWADRTSSMKQKGVVIAYGDPAHTRLIYVLTTTENPPTTEADASFAAGYEKGLERSGGSKRISSRFVEVHGIMSYERTGSMAPKGKSISTLARNIPIRGRFYAITAMRFDGGLAGEDAEIRSFVESFRFLTPPQRVLDSSAAVRFGSFVSQSMLTIAAIIGVIMLIRHISRSNRPPRPPPLPTAPPPPPKSPPPLPE